MKRFRLWKHLSAIATCLWAIPLGTNPAVAQDPDSLTINGTLIMLSSSGTIAPDLAAIAAKGDTYTWTMTMHGLSYEYDYQDFSTDPYEVYVRYVTRIRATSFDFEFQGPDAAELNAIVNSEWVTNGFLYGAMLELRHVILTNHDWGGLEDAGDWILGITTLESGPGIHFGSIPYALDAPFPVDENGYPMPGPFVSVIAWTSIGDNRDGNAGSIGTQGLNSVAIDAPLPPLPAPPPPPPPTLSIADASVREGNKGTTRLNLAVTLSRSTSDTVTVHYATANGTAQKKSDYTATSGTLTIPAGQTQGAISVAIKGDRKRERDETFFVQLSNAVGAEISDGVATVTILNDD